VQGPEGLFVRQLHAKAFVSWQLSFGIHSQPGVQVAGGRVAGRAAGAATAGAVGGRPGAAGVATGTAGVTGHCGQGPDGLSLRQLQATALVSLQLSFGIHSQPVVKGAAGGATATGADAVGGGAVGGGGGGGAAAATAAGACGTGGDGASTGATAGVAGCAATGGMGAGPDGVARGNAVPSIAAGAGTIFGLFGVLVGFEFADLAAAAGAELSALPARLGAAGPGATAGGGFGTVFNADVEPNAPYLTLEKVTEIGDCVAFA